jgi:hypothetical protein
VNYQLELSEAGSVSSTGGRDIRGIQAGAIASDERWRVRRIAFYALIAGMISPCGLTGVIGTIFGPEPHD